MNPIRVLVSGRSAPQCSAVHQLLEGQADVQVTVQVLDAQHCDPLNAPVLRPDVLVAVLDADSDAVLQALAAHPAAQRPTIIAVGPAGNPAMMRSAMQAGARDYFTPPLQQADLLQALQRIKRDVVQGGEKKGGARGQLLAVINAKGGSGASTIAANLAHIAATKSHREVGLIDLDLQFGTLPLLFDLSPPGTLLNVLAAADKLEPRGLADYAMHHRSGVNLISAMSDQMPLPWEVSAQALGRVLDVARLAYDLVLVDLPRQIDPLTNTVLMQADKVLIVMQQSLVHVRDAKRMLRILTSTLAVPSDNIVIVVNRHVERGGLSVEDINEAVAPPCLALLPNDYRAVIEAQNIGVPLYEHDHRSEIARALEELLEQVTSVGSAEPAPRRGRLHTMLSKVLRS